MKKSQVIWIVVIVLAIVAILGTVIYLRSEKSQKEDHSAAAESNEQPSQEQGSQVVEATDETIHDLLNSDKTSIVLFHAPWCGFCRQTKPIFEGLSKHLDSTHQIVLANTEEHAGIRKMVEGKGLPTIRKYRGGKPAGEEIVGARSEPELLQYARQ